MDITHVSSVMWFTLNLLFCLKKKVYIEHMIATRQTANGIKG